MPISQAGRLGLPESQVLYVSQSCAQAGIWTQDCLTPKPTFFSFSFTNLPASEILALWSQETKHNQIYNEK